MYKEHIYSCQNRAEQHVQSKATTAELVSQSAQTMYSIRQDLLLFSKITLEESDLFRDSKIFDREPYVKLPNYRTGVVPHLFIKKLLLEESDAAGLKERPDYWNL